MPHKVFTPKTPVNFGVKVANFRVTYLFVGDHVVFGRSFLSPQCNFTCNFSYVAARGTSADHVAAYRDLLILEN